MYRRYRGGILEGIFESLEEAQQVNHPTWVTWEPSKNNSRILYGNGVYAAYYRILLP